MKLSKKNIAIKEKYDKRMDEINKMLRALVNEPDYQDYHRIQGFYPDNIPKPFKRDPDSGNHPCCDHKRVFTDEDGNKIYESHPYGVGMKKLKGLIEWCEERGLTFTIDAYSTWNPMNTVRIQFHTTPIFDELERLKRLKGTEFKIEMSNMLGITDEYLKTATKDTQRAYFTTYVKMHKSPDLNTAVLVSFKFDESLKKIVMKDFMRNPNKKVILLTVLEIINGVTIDDKIKELDFHVKC